MWLTIFACLAHYLEHSEFRVRGEDRLEIQVLLFMNADPNPYPDQDKTAKHESISRSSAFVHNEYFGKIRCELRSERKQKDKDRI
jgi:hypothetical protein